MSRNLGDAVYWAIVGVLYAVGMILRDAVLSCIEFGTEVAKVNSNARSEAELHPQREMPQWHW